MKLSKAEYNALLNDNPDAGSYIRKLVGGSEFLNGQQRWCIWIEDSDVKIALNIKPIEERVHNVKKFRENGGEVASSLVDRSHQFRYRHEAQ